MDIIELRMDRLRRYVITMPDEHCYYALALTIQPLNSASGTLFPLLEATRSSQITGNSS